MYTIKVIEDNGDYVEEKVFPCTHYGRTYYKGDLEESDSGETSYRNADTAYHHITAVNGDQQNRIRIPHSVIENNVHKEIYIMNEEGKTIDSY